MDVCSSFYVTWLLKTRQTDTRHLTGSWWDEQKNKQNARSQKTSNMWLPTPSWSSHQSPSSHQVFSINSSKCLWITLSTVFHTGTIPPIDSQWSLRTNKSIHSNICKMKEVQLQRTLTAVTVLAHLWVRARVSGQCRRPGCKTWPCRWGRAPCCPATSQAAAGPAGWQTTCPYRWDTTWAGSSTAGTPPRLLPGTRAAA